MRITALAVATLLLAAGIARTTLGQAPASAKAQGITWQPSLQTKPTTPLAQQREMGQQSLLVAPPFAVSAGGLVRWPRGALGGAGGRSPPVRPGPPGTR